MTCSPALGQDVVDHGPSEEAVQTAKRQSLNSFVFNVSSTARQLQQLVASAAHGLPEDEVFRFRDSVQATDLQAIKSAAQAHLHPHDQACPSPTCIHPHMAKQ